MARILLGVAGSIAAYRSPDLVKALKAKGHDVQVVLTRSGSQFVTPKALETFSGNKVLSNDVWDEDNLGTDHIKHARWADIFVVYGVTANFMAKLASGFCDDFLSLQILATKAPVLLVPAMNVEMWKNPATQENYKKLISRTFQFEGPIEGTLACGETGLGHVADIGDVVFATEALVEAKGISPSMKNYFQGKNVLVSIGSMRTSVDDVRFLQNKSTGRMGIEVAKSLSQLGAKVHLLAGLVDAEVESELFAYNSANFSFDRFESFSEYREKLVSLFPNSEVFFSIAAVLDFEVNTLTGKLERGVDHLSLELLPTEDMVLWTTSHKKAGQKVIAFSLEAGATWPACLERAHKKLLKKKADLIVVNRSSVENEGPGAKTNSMYLLAASGQLKQFPLEIKGELAWDLCRDIGRFFDTEEGKEIAPLAPILHS